MSWIVNSETSLLGLGDDRPETVYSGDEEKKIARNLRGLTRSSSSSSSSFLVVICFGGAFGATIAIMESANQQT